VKGEVETQKECPSESEGPLTPLSVASDELMLVAGLVVGAERTSAEANPAGNERLNTIDKVTIDDENCHVFCAKDERRVNAHTLIELIYINQIKLDS
jgi:hypothetical protein